MQDVTRWYGMFSSADDDPKEKNVHKTAQGKAGQVQRWLEAAMKKSRAISFETFSQRSGLGADREEMSWECYMIEEQEEGKVLVRYLINLYAVTHIGKGGSAWLFSILHNLSVNHPVAKVFDMCAKEFGFISGYPGDNWGDQIERRCGTLGTPHYASSQKELCESISRVHMRHSLSFVGPQ